MTARPSQLGHCPCLRCPDLDRGGLGLRSLDCYASCELLTQGGHEFPALVHRLEKGMEGDRDWGVPSQKQKAFEQLGQQGPRCPERHLLPSLGVRLCPGLTHGEVAEHRGTV